jgi:hypothetical protein
MATRKFTDFELRTPQTLTPNDYIVGYKNDASGELRTSVRNLTAVFGSVFAGATGAVGGPGATGSSGFSFNYTPITTNTNLQTNTGYIVNTTLTGVLTGTLPSTPSVGHFVNFLITASTPAPFVIARNNSNINNIAENLICDVTGNFTLVYTNETVGWKFVPFSGITTPAVKIFKATWEGPYTGPQDNLQGPSPRIPFNNTAINTDTNTFGGLQTPGSQTQTSVLIRESGYYRIDTNIHIMDLQEGRELLTQIWQFRDGVGDTLLQTVADTAIGTTSPAVAFIPGSTVVHLPNANTHIYIVLNHNVPFPGPFPSTIDNFNSTGTKGPTEIIITKLG